jgi:hypothetical protein
MWHNATSHFIIIISMQKIFILIFSFLLLLACHNTKNSTENKVEANVTQNTNLPDSIYRFTVSFISIGSGTDHKAKQQFSQFIQQFNEKNNVKINAETTNWGREGEIDYCLKLNELNEQQQIQFISETEDLLKDSSLVRYYENSICRHKKK